MKTAYAVLWHWYHYGDAEQRRRAVDVAKKKGAKKKRKAFRRHWRWHVKRELSWAWIASHAEKLEKAIYAMAASEKEC